MSSARTYAATIERIVERTADTRSFFLRVDDCRRFSFVPGQFLSFLLPVHGETLTRAYTIASLPQETARLEICLNRVVDSRGSAYLFSRRESDVLRFTGPWGRFTLDLPSNAEHVFIADRVGVVPFRSMLTQILTTGTQPPVTRLLYGVPHEADLLYVDEWRDWERKCTKFSFRPLMPGDEPATYSIPNTLMPYIEQQFVNRGTNRDRRFYICGIGRPTLSLRDLLRGAGYPRHAVKYEKW